MSDLRYPANWLHAIPVWLLLAFLLSTHHLSAEIPMRCADNPKVSQALDKMESGQHKEARLLLESALEDYPLESMSWEHIEVQWQLGKLLVHQYDFESAKTQYQFANNLAKKYGHNELQANTYSALAVLARFEAQIDILLLYGDSILQLEGISPNTISEAYILKCIYFDHIAAGDSMLFYALKSYHIDQKHDDTASLVMSSSNVATAHEYFGNVDSSIAYYLESTEYARAVNNVYVLADIYMKIGGIFRDMDNLYKARDYVNLGLDVAKNAGLKSKYSLILLLLAELDEMEGKYESAIENFETASIHFDTINDVRRLVQSQLGLINSLLQVGNADKAKLLLNQIEIHTEKIELDKYRIGLYFSRAQVAANDQKFDEALSSLVNAEEKLKTYSNVFMKSRLHKLYAQVYASKKDFESALYHNNRYHQYRDTASSRNQAFIVNDLEAKYRKVQQERQIQSLTSEKSELGDRLSRRNRLIGTILLLLTIAMISAFFAIRLYRKVKGQNHVISNALEEKETLLKEVHHRVKNNLQIISSLLSLQARGITDAKAAEALQESQTRVRSMALIHQNLYQKEEFVAVNVEEYVDNMMDELMKTYAADNKKIEVIKNVEPLELDLDTVIPLGLVINELITNTLKYAFKGRDSGMIHIDLHETTKGLNFKIADDGVGLPPKWDISKSKTLGFRLVKSFCRKMEAQLEISSQSGTTIEISIPLHTENYLHHAKSAHS